ncbi:MAG: hypothetical protein NUV40_00795, partial [Patescibacteria group bacterium]|nr:hypothetical protein [Patescibacteria group bacterium]
MKKSIFICVFCLFLFSINCAAEEQGSPEDYKTTQLVWNKLLDNINERLFKLEREFAVEKKQRQEFNSKINDNLNNLTKIINARIDKVEKTASFIEANNVATSFKETIGVLNKTSSDMKKRVEALEVSIATVEKIYYVSQKPLETLMKAIGENAAVINKINEKLEKQEKILLAINKGSENRDTHRESNKVPEFAAAGTEEKRTTLPETAGGTVASETERAGTQKPSGSEKDIFVRNVSMPSTGSATSIIGEIINKSNVDYAVANFKIRLYDKGDNLLNTLDLVIINFSAGSTKEFDKLISGVDSKSIARYVILFNDSELTTYREEKEIVEEQKTKEVKVEDKEARLLPATEDKEARLLPAEEKTVQVAKTSPPVDKEFKAIGSDYYVRDVTFSALGSSTTVKGEIKNDSRENISSALFGLKVLGK